MSDRSLELFKQASAEAYRLCREKNHDVSEIDPIWVSVMAGTLTELIVQDCCAKLVEMGQGWIDFAQHPPRGQEHNVSGALFAASRLREDAVYEIKEHFGVNNES